MKKSQYNMSDENDSNDDVKSILTFKSCLNNYQDINQVKVDDGQLLLCTWFSETFDTAMESSLSKFLFLNLGVDKKWFKF
jgi:hypothetical protein